MKFIFDENLPQHIANGMSCLDKEVMIEHVLDSLGRGTVDTDLLKYVGQNQYFLITKDTKMRYNPAEKAAFIKYNVGAFILIGKAMRLWDIVKQIINSWELIKELSKTVKKPFIYKIRRSGKPERVL